MKYSWSKNFISAEEALEALGLETSNFLSDGGRRLALMTCDSNFGRSLCHN